MSPYPRGMNWPSPKLWKRHNAFSQSLRKKIKIRPSAASPPVGSHEDPLQKVGGTFRSSVAKRAIPPSPIPDSDPASKNYHKGSNHPAYTRTPPSPPTCLTPS